VLAVLEYARLTMLSRIDVVLLLVLAVGYPLLAWFAPDWLHLAPLAALLCALPPVRYGDVVGGIRRAAFTAFGSIWICWSLAHLVVLWENAFLVCFAAAATDVAAWCGGRGLQRFGWARRSRSPLSPNKTVGGLVGAVLGRCSLGTQDVLPKHGRVRRAPMEVRIGVPQVPEETDAAHLRSDVLALLDITSLPADTGRPANTALRLPAFTAPDTAASVLSR
jgi:hypothetical protein